MLEARPALRLAITQRSALRRLCSAAKERMLSPSAPSHVAVTILGTGRALVGDAITTELTREDVERTFADFLPVTASHEFATPRDRRAGLRELGLPYETDPAITRHLASFLARSAAALPEHHRAKTTIDGRRMVRPDARPVQRRFLHAAGRARPRRAARWARGSASRRGCLRTSHLEAAVAIGAATYARLRAEIGAAPARSGRPRGRRSSRAVTAPGQGGQRARVLRRSACAATPAKRWRPCACWPAAPTKGPSRAIEHPFTIATNRSISFPLYSSTLRSDSTGEHRLAAP